MKIQAPVHMRRIGEIYLKGSGAAASEVEEVLEGDVGRRVSKVVKDLENVPSRSVHVIV